MKLSPLHSILTKLNASFEDQHGWQVANQIGSSEAGQTALQSGVAIADLSSTGKIVVEGQQASAVIDQGLGVAASGLNILSGLDAGSFGVYRLRTDQYFVHSVSAASAELAEKLNAAAPAPTSSADLVTVSNVTEGRSEIILMGPAAAELLARLCGLDFSDAAFPNLQARQTSVAKTGQLILRHDRLGQAAYGLIGERSLAAYLWETTVQAGHDLNIQPVGLSILADPA